MDFMGTLKSKVGGIPVWVIALLGTIGLALYLRRRNAKANAQTDAAANQTNTDLGSAQELANMFNVAGLMPYQGGDIYVNTTEPKGGANPPGTPKPSPPVGKDIQTSSFYKTTKVTDWNTLAKQLGVFGGSGIALYEYNLIPNKHSPATIADFKKTPKTVKKGEEIAVPLKGVNISLPNVGVIKS